MFWIGLLIGLIIGTVFGLIFFCIGQIRIEKTAVENKLVKLESKYYEITEVKK